MSHVPEHRRTILDDVEDLKNARGTIKQNIGDDTANPDVLLVALYVSKLNRTIEKLGDKIDALPMKIVQMLPKR